MFATSETGKGGVMSLDDLLTEIRELRAMASERHDSARLHHIQTKMFTLGQIAACDALTRRLTDICSEECGRRECKERLEALRQIWRLLEELEL
jgi:hypothetical protein